MGVVENVAARQAAELVCELMREESANHRGYAEVVFWERCQRQISEVLPLRRYLLSEKVQKEQETLNGD